MVRNKAQVEAQLEHRRKLAEPVPDDPAKRSVRSEPGDLSAVTDVVGSRSQSPRLGDLKLFEPITICPLVTLRDRGERYRSPAYKNSTRRSRRSRSLKLQVGRVGLEPTANGL